MSHDTQIRLIADQCVTFEGEEFNMHDILSVIVNSAMTVTAISVNDATMPTGFRWIYRSKDEASL